MHKIIKEITLKNRDNILELYEVYKENPEVVQEYDIDIEDYINELNIKKLIEFLKKAGNDGVDIFDLIGFISFIESNKN